MPELQGTEIAIVGMAGRFPGAPDLEQFWRNLRDGVESIRLLEDHELDQLGVDPALYSSPGYVRACADLDGIQLFDAAFFGYTPRDAELIDPQHRLFLECAWEALENAGYAPESYDGAVGVFAGTMLSTYLLYNLMPNRQAFSMVDPVQVTVSNGEDFLTTRVSYNFNLRGPSYTVQTACSTSLVAVHLACQSLLNRECDAALAGGVCVQLTYGEGYHYSEGGMASPDGRTRTFDAQAQGTIFGNGLGIVVLKRLEDAIVDGDSIRAVIRGSAINNDGAVRVSYTAPGVDGQTAVIAEALVVADIEPETIDYVETHGTATRLGDSIEFQAMCEAFGSGSLARNYCGIGSVKTNIGHLAAASGIAGLIKTVLALQHRQIPPSLHFTQPNPELDFAGSPFFVNAQLAEWPQRADRPRRAGVNSFGLGGTNAHVVLEEAPPLAPSSPSRSQQLLLLSAKTASALERASANLAGYLRTHPDISLADLAYTLQVGRQPFNHRLALVCSDTAGAAGALETGDPQRLLSGLAEQRDRPVAFMFPGMGDQYLNMALGLYQTEPVFRAAVDRCAELLAPVLGSDPREVLYPAGTQPPTHSPAAPVGTPPIDLRKLLRRGATVADDNTQRLNQTALAHPILFMVEYALAQLWMEWGIQPRALIGHSIGEYVVACLAGVFTLEDALLLVARRAQLIQALPPGAMLAVLAPEERVQSLLGEDLSLSAVNAPLSCVVAGAPEAVAALERRLQAEGVACQRLYAHHAFHSAMMEPIVEPFRELLGQISFNPPAIPFISNMTGTWITAAEATDPDYWARHMRQTVRFADGLGELLKHPAQILLEVGPGLTLSTLATQRVNRSAQQVVLTSLRHPHDPQPDGAFLLTTLARLWLAGASVSWPGFYAHEQRRRMPLPTYPFERQRYWIERPATSQEQPAITARGKNPQVADWFFLPSWQQAPPLPPPEPGEIPRHWLVFVDAHQLGAALVEQLIARSQAVVTVAAGPAFGKAGDGTYTIDPRRGEDYLALVRDLAADGQLPDIIAHAWNLATEAAPSMDELFDQQQERGYYSLLFLAHALAAAAPEHSARIGVITRQLYQVAGDETICPEKATLIGPCKVIPQEHANLSCVCIDVAPAGPHTRQGQQLVECLIAELAAETEDTVVAYRAGRRWIQHYLPAPLCADSATRRPLRERGVYWIIGGLGNVGYLVAERLTRSVAARLVLSSRAGLPPREAWDGILAGSINGDATAQAIRQVRALEALGAEVLVVQADVADEAQMRAARAQIGARFGQLHGVIHMAGVTSGPSVHRALVEIGRAESEAQFRPKVRGIYVLERVLAGEPIDFCILFSSSSALLGGLGFVAYAAAHAFVDTFATARSQTSAVPWLSANWDLWPAVTQPAPTTQSSFDQYAMSPAESQEAFERLARMAPEGQVVIITGDLQPRLDLWVRRAAGRGGQPSALHARPALARPYVAPRDETERQIAMVWSQVLGIEQVGVHDNFFELGGHSLLLPQIINGLRQALQVELPVRALFAHATVAGLAELIAGGGLQASTDDQEPIAVRIQAAFPTERPALVSSYVRQKIALALGLAGDQLPVDGGLSAFDPQVYAMDLLVHFKQDLQIQAFPQEIQRLPSIDAMTRFVLTEIDRATDLARVATRNPLSAYTVQPYRKQAAELAPPPPEKGRPLALILSPPRAGSTIFRVMLAGHPALFCPPELYLLHFETMREWDQNVGFGDMLAWNRQGLELAFSELLGGDQAASQARIARLIEQNAPIYRVYGELQELAGDRLLIDKSPTYALDPEALQRAEHFFAEPKYLHLLRHPYTVIESFLRARLDKLLGPNLFKEPDVDPYVVAETVWAVANHTTLAFLAGIPAARQHQVVYERLVSDSAVVMAGVCDFLGIPFDERVLRPYDNPQKRMAGGIGDPNIFRHRSINSERGEAWRNIRLPRYLDATTRQVALQLGYELPGDLDAPSSDQSGAAPAAPPLDLDQLSDEEVDRLLSQLVREETI